MNVRIFTLIFFLFIPSLLFSQFIEPSIKWEYFHSAGNENKTFFTGKKISYSERMNGVFVSIDNSDSLPTLMFLDSAGNLRKIITNSDGNDFAPNFKVDQYNLNKYAHIFADGNSKTGLPSQVNIWKDENGDPVKTMRLSYNPETQQMSTNNTFIGSIGWKELPYSTMISPSTPDIFYTISHTKDTIGTDSVKISTNVFEFKDGGTFVKTIDSIVSFTFPLDSNTLYPYPMAVVKSDDADEYYILHAPDTVYRGSKFRSVYVTKHNSDFSIDTIYKPITTFILFENDPPFGQWQKKFVPKSLSVSKSWFAIAGEAKDSADFNTALVYCSTFTPLSLITYRSSTRWFINSCRVNDKGVVVAVGKKFNSTNGSMDNYIDIYDPNGLPKFQDFSWGSGADEELSDVTFVENGDIVVSGSVEGNCYIARLGILTYTSAQETIPFSSTIGFAPNPASSQTLVRFAPTTDGIATAELYDMRGMKVKQLFSEQVQRGNEYTFPAPVSDVPNGVYTVIITNGITKHHQQLQVIR